MKRVARVEKKYDIKILKKCIVGVKTSVFPLLRNVIMDYYSGLSSFMHVVISLYAILMTEKTTSENVACLKASVLTQIS